MKKILTAIMVFSVVFGFNQNSQASTLKKAGKFVAGYLVGFVFHEGGHQYMAMSEGESLKWETSDGRLQWSAQSDSVLYKDTSYWTPKHDPIPIEWGWRMIYNQQTHGFERKYVVIRASYSELLSTPENIKEAEKSILLGGVITQVVSSEILLKEKDLHKNPFKKGWLFFDCVNYTWRKAAIGGKGDIIDLKEAGANPEKTRNILVLHALFTAWRYYHPESTKLVPDVEFTPRNNGIHLEWKIKF